MSSDDPEGSDTRDAAAGDVPGAGAGVASGAGAAPRIEPWLREILRCPACHGELADATGPDGGPELVCTAPGCGLAYRVEDGVPVLLVDEARRPG